MTTINKFNARVAKVMKRLVEWWNEESKWTGIFRSMM